MGAGAAAVAACAAQSTLNDTYLTLLNDISHPCILVSVLAYYGHLSLG